MPLPTTSLPLGDFEISAAPKTGTDGGHDLAPGHPQNVDRALLVEDATEHPALAPATGSSEGEQRAGAGLDAAIQHAREEGETTLPIFVHDPLVDILGPR